MGKADIKYWNIDKLRNFVQSDIASNPSIKKMFIEAGCGDLFNLSIEGSDVYSGKIHLANAMLKYLGKGIEEEADEFVQPESDQTSL